MWKAVITDLNDLERPDIHCKPNTPDILNKTSPPGSVASPLYAASSSSHSASGNPSPVARIPLQDCLSCTGCLTLAEEQLSAKSRNQVVQLCNSWLEQGQQVLFSLQPQAVAAIAVQLGVLDCALVAQKIASACKQKGVKWVTDEKEARYFSLLETWEELVHRYETNQRLPLIISACPAWVSFMKRKRPEWVECLSEVYSPVLMTGYLWKRKRPNIKHVAVASCYEMAVQTQTQAAEYPDSILVDALWTTQQLIEWLDWTSVDGIDFITPTPLDTLWISLSSSDLCQGTSHGYFWMAVDRWIDKVTVEHAFLPQVEWNSHPESLDNQQQVCIRWKSNSQDATMKRIRMVLAYGYQSLQRWVRRGLDSDVILLEAMACPYGCINGSGQLLPKNQSKTPKEQRQYLQSLVNPIETNIGKRWSQWKNSLDGQRLGQAYAIFNRSDDTLLTCPPQLYWNTNHPSVDTNPSKETKVDLDW